MKCYYCEKREAVAWLFNKPTCRGCNKGYLIKKVEAKKEELSEEKMAEIYKVLLYTFLPL